MIKTLLIRVFVVYMISSLFRRGSQPQQQAGSGPGAPASMGAVNLLAKDPLMVRSIYFEILMFL